METKTQKEAEPKEQQRSEAKAKAGAKVKVVLCCVYGKHRPNEEIPLDIEKAEMLISKNLAKKV